MNPKLIALCMALDKSLNGMPQLIGEILDEIEHNTEQHEERLKQRMALTSMLQRRFLKAFDLIAASSCPPETSMTAQQPPFNPPHFLDSQYVGEMAFPQMETVNPTTNLAEAGGIGVVT